MKVILPFLLLVLATALEAGGDAVVRVGLKQPHALPMRVLIMLAGAAVLYGYGLFLNLSPLDWGRLIGGYVAVFFVMAQIINLVAFGVAPTLPIVVGGSLIIAGGLIITVWR